MKKSITNICVKQFAQATLSQNLSQGILTKPLCSKYVPDLVLKIDHSRNSTAAHRRQVNTYSNANKPRMNCKDSRQISKNTLMFPKIKNF